MSKEAKGVLAASIVDAIKASCKCRSDSSGPLTERLHSLGAAAAAASVADTRGKHRIQAELKRIEQEARFLEAKLEQLDKLEKASTACKEMLNNVESRPDPLLPM
ncbi:unnamed protein product [Dovyalis caffra]|uniref:G protein gamma domain-containing protein n=1 Tax=Dovyalis caffra TaxID=77055 RepID=A0AAV1RMZ9_9ROSI|nr:unnamed protein product [Dovyalis caffra]